jgi:1D-myo-inositol-tetrakisphosphate 5-kinase/inositol-polyphosphate multikinase
LKASDLPLATAKIFPLIETGLGHPKEILLPILELIKAQVEELRNAIAELEIRIIGSSLLIVYEGHGDAAQEILKNMETLSTTRQDGDQEKEDAEIADEEEIEVEYEDEDEGDEGDISGDIEDEDDEGGDLPLLPCAVKLIDFGHTRLKPGEGADTSVLLGLDTVLKLIDGRIEEISGVS